MNPTLADLRKGEFSGWDLERQYLSRHWYSLSTDLNPNWERRYASQQELRSYWENLWHKYNLPSYTRLGTSVLFSEWDEKNQRWVITIQEEANDGKRETIEAELLFFAVGAFTAPKYPKDVRGMDKFKGEWWHSSQWRHDVSLSGKKVGVIGNGCSAAQFVPEISTDPTVEVINFVRTPQWYIAKDDFAYPGWLKWIFANVPLVMRWYRNWLMFRADVVFVIFNKQNKRLVSYTRKVMEQYIRKTAPKEYADKLIPSYMPGCRRIIIDPDYLSCLHRPNVTLRWDAVESLIEEGIKLKSDEVVPLDIVIFGTGYSVEPISLNVRGRGGKHISEYFNSKQGPTAYLGSCYPGFPNMFTFLGPNVSGGHYSVIFCEEVQINHSLQLIKPVLEGKIKSVEVTDEATDSYNDWLQERLSKSVWTDCDSYYYHYLREGTKTKNVASFPGPATLFWWLGRRPSWEKFRVVGGERPQQGIGKYIVHYSSALVVLVLAYVAYRH
ncbi:monooxygenase [Coprinopsis cinerea okayama7|uniref:Monooxygenase n=1 Tax=Coprinopsis cinerea (strain Okayama-7 / 130 / ATCC MYA-4618 / FGSC 9003) TaxID=240176 RepID=D6RKL4_COPC7|nr:monooxygenase [Coprinopsis cinerea okayama7\|eukprot:XP_002911840.1 monooxygenase [Coprinopsis cinerea okayama7\